MSGAEIDAIREALLLAADGREEYAESGGTARHGDEFLLGQAAGFRAAAGLLNGRDARDFLASEIPSWRWTPEVHAYVMRNPRLERD